MHKLTFCNIEIIEDNIAEVIFNKNVLVSEDMVDEFLQALQDDVGTGISVMVNKVTTYTYRYDALVKLSHSTIIKNLALVAYDDVSISMSEFNRQKFNKTDKNINVFTVREEALAWLRNVAS